MALSHLVFPQWHPKRQKKAIFDNFLTQKFNILHFKKIYKKCILQKKTPKITYNSLDTTFIQFRIH